MPTPPHEPGKVFEYVDRIKALPPATTIEKRLHNEYTYTFSAPTAAHAAAANGDGADNDATPKFFGHPAAPSAALPPLEAFDRPSMLRSTFERDHPRPTTGGSAAGSVAATAAGSPSASLRRSVRTPGGPSVPSGPRCDKITVQAMRDFLKGVGASDGDCVTANDHAVRMLQVLRAQYDTNAPLSTAPVGVGARGVPASESSMRRLAQPLGERPLRRRDSEADAGVMSDRETIAALEREVRSQGFEIERLERRLRMRVTTTDVRVVENRAADLKESVTAMRQEVGFIADDTREAFAEFKREFEAIPCVREARANDPAARARAVTEALNAAASSTDATPAADGAASAEQEKAMSAGAVLRATMRLVEAAAEAASHRSKVFRKTTAESETTKAMALKLGRDLGAEAATLPDDAISGVAAYAGTESASVQRGLRAALWMLAAADNAEGFEAERLKRDAAIARLEAQLHAIESKTPPTAGGPPPASSPKAAAAAQGATAKKSGGVAGGKSAVTAAAAKATAPAATPKAKAAPVKSSGGPKSTTSAKSPAPAPAQTPKATTKAPPDAATPVSRVKPAPASSEPPSPTPPESGAPAALEEAVGVERAPPTNSAVTAGTSEMVLPAPTSPVAATTPPTHSASSSPTPAATSSEATPAATAAPTRSPAAPRSAVTTTPATTPTAAPPPPQERPSPAEVAIAEAPTLESQLAHLVAAEPGVADVPLRHVVDWIAGGRDPHRLQELMATQPHLHDGTDDTGAPAPRQAEARDSQATSHGQQSSGAKAAHGRAATNAPPKTRSKPSTTVAASAGDQSQSQPRRQSTTPQHPSAQPTAASMASDPVSADAEQQQQPMGDASPTTVDAMPSRVAHSPAGHAQPAQGSAVPAARSRRQSVAAGGGVAPQQLPVDGVADPVPGQANTPGRGSTASDLPAVVADASPPPVVAKTPGIETQKVLKFRISAKAATPPPSKTRVVEGAAEAAKLERMRRALESGLQLQRFKEHSHLLFDSRCDVQVPEPAGEANGLVGLTPPRR